jgi:outer membrane protein assembly factor BamC
VARADLKQGIIETGWLQFKADPNTQDKYRLQIDQGIQPETSEIHITHISVPGAAKPTIEPEWPAKSVNAEREKWMLDELAATLASDTVEGGTSLLAAQGLGSSAAAKAALGMYRNEPVMTLKVDRVRTMATITYAAKRDGFQLLDSDSGTGLFYVFYQKPEDAKPGWFKRLFRIGLKPKPATSPYSLEELAANMLKGEEFEAAPYTNRSAEKNLKKAPGYLIVVTGKPGDYVIRARDPYGKRLKPKEARELLTVLRKNLI